MSEPALKVTPLSEAHATAGARMIEFAGYSMPLQYREGVLKEHVWTRSHAGLFDVSHMGPAFLRLTRPSGEAEADHNAISTIIEPLISGDVRSLLPGQIRYTLLLSREGGILDDLMVGRPRLTNRQGMLQLIVNAATKEADFARIAAVAADRAELIRADDRALIAIQGPEAAAVAAAILPETAELRFMELALIMWRDQRLVASRSGYTGEDGFEILVPAAIAGQLWDAFLEDARVLPIGLAARDTLRLEAGLPLYGHDMDASVSPIEAGLAFAVSRRRRRAGDLAGAARIEREIAQGPPRLRIGLKVLEGAPAREGAEIRDKDGRPVGKVTSGGFSPSLTQSIAMGFVPPALAEPKTRLEVVVRDRAQPAEVVPLPFLPHRYVR